MTTLFFAIAGVIVLLFVMLVAILHVGAHKPMPQPPLLKWNPNLLNPQRRREKPLTSGLSYPLLG